MTVSATCTAHGMLVTLQGGSEGATVLIPAHMTISAIENHLRELSAFYE